jgi:signal transduction histidine kinase/HAMP domain-containing protein
MPGQTAAMTAVYESSRLARTGLALAMAPVRAATLFLRDLPKTIRGKIFLAFAALAALTLLLGLAGMNSVGGAGRLIVESFDQPLASISYARLGLADFIAMESAAARRATMADPEHQRDLDQRMDRLVRETGLYLRLAVSRTSSRGAAEAASATANDVARWDAARRDATLPIARRHDPLSLERHGALVLDDFDRLVALTAEDGLGARQRALEAIADYRRLTFLAMLFAFLVGGLVAVLLARRMVRPIAEASRAANRIAAGDLDVDIDHARQQDEFGTLLAAMAAMRDNIRAMMQREISARRAAQDGLAVAIESSPAGVVLMDRLGRVAVANSEARQLFPDLADQLVAGARFPDRLAVALEGAGELRLDDGRWLKLSRRLTQDGGFVAVASDITGLKERESALVIAKEAAEAASRAKSDFLANMSHELRTPLNAVIGFSEMISGEMLGPVGQPKYKEFAGDILFSGRHLLQIINHVLDIAKLQWGRMEIERDATDLATVVEDAMRIARVQAQASGLALETAIEDGLPPIDGDAIRLRQVLLNLLSNATKFTPAGGRIEVGLRRAGAMIALTVRDTGIGMKPTDIPKALEPFQQVDSSITRKYGGTGLGLPLCKLFVELHGGDLAVTSQPGQGTLVTATLPIHHDAPALEAVAA